VIAIVDYKAGNLTSVKKAFDHLGAETVVTADPAEVRLAEKIILPGVGHFAATKVLDDSGLREAIIEQIEGTFVYFTHSYRVPLLSSTVADCEYGGGFSAVVEQENMFGAQFHPEKSGSAGLRMLENFCAL